MTYYGGKELAAAFRTVRKNTIQLAEDIPADQYDFRPTPEVMSVAQQLAHLVAAPQWQIDNHGQGVKFIDFAMFGQGMARAAAAEQALRTKDEILAALRADGEKFATFLEGLDENKLREEVGFPPPVQPATKTRFEMLLGVKEHEMHHRAQLMLIQRLLGIVPHLSRQRAERMAASTAGKSQS